MNDVNEVWRKIHLHCSFFLLQGLLPFLYAKYCTRDININIIVDRNKVASKLGSGAGSNTGVSRSTVARPDNYAG